MSQTFELGKLYEFIEDGEDLPVEHSYQTFFKKINFNKDASGYYSFGDGINDLIYVGVISGTIALCLGEEHIQLLSQDFKMLESHKYYKLLIGDQIVILLHKEKNLYSFVELDS